MIDRLLNVCIFLVEFFRLLAQLFRLLLIDQSFRMVMLCIIRVKTDCCIKVFMSFRVLLIFLELSCLVQIHIATVEIVVSIVRIQKNRLLIILQSIDHVTKMILSQASILVVER